MEQKITRAQILHYYSDERITDQIFRHSKDREVAGALWDGSYEKRPNILQFPTDIAQMVRKGVTSFHYSAERWKNPMALAPSNYEDLRTGWDLVIDIDSKLSLNESKLGARLVCGVLEKYGVKNYIIKFSGRRGFHIILPWNMFPKDVDYKPLSRQYPNVPRTIIGFIRESIREKMSKELASLGHESGNPFSLVEIEKDWGSRHMFRAPYSFNEKTWLVSVPVEDIDKFRPEDASHDKVLRREKFPEIMNGEDGEASGLLLEAIDWGASQKPEEKPAKKRKIYGRISEEFFPPCIKTILSGMADGKKRSLFTLTNFLRTMNWEWDEIEERVYKWNEGNRPPLPRTIISGHLRHAQRRDASPPANCSSDSFYGDIGICIPDKICGILKITVKNPVNYPPRKTGGRKLRGYSCICGEEFETLKMMTMHKSKNKCSKLPKAFNAVK